MVTGEQIRGARAMLGWDQAELAERADVAVKTIKRMEGQNGPIDARSNYSVMSALERGGIEFLDGDGDYRTRGEGIRFSKDPTGRIRRELVESAGRWLDATLKIATDDDRDFFERPIQDILAKIKADFEEGLERELSMILHKHTST